MTDIIVQQGCRECKFLFTRRAEFANPNVPEAYRVAMVLERDGLFLRMRFVRSAFEPTGRAGQLHVVLNQHAIVKHSEVDWRCQRAVGLKTRGGINDVVDLPFPRWATRID